MHVPVKEMANTFDTLCHLEDINLLFCIFYDYRVRYPIYHYIGAAYSYCLHDCWCDYPKVVADAEQA